MICDNFDVWTTVLVQLGNTAEGFVERCKIRRVSKFFRNFTPILESIDGQCTLTDYIIRYQLNTYFTAVFDCDSLKWKHTADRNSYLLTSLENDALFYNKFTKKYIRHVKQGKRMLCLQSSNQIVQPSTIDICKHLALINKDALINAPIRNNIKRTTDINAYIDTKFNQMIHTVCKALNDPINASITCLNLKNTSIDNNGLQCLAKTLIASNIRKLNLSMTHTRTFAPIFDNGHLLNHLDISNCVYLSNTDVIALLRLIFRSSQLTYLNTSKTIIECYINNKHPTIPFASLIKRSSIQKLCYSYDNDESYHILQEAIQSNANIKEVEAHNATSQLYATNDYVNEDLPSAPIQFLNIADIQILLNINVKFKLQLPKVILKRALPPFDEPNKEPVKQQTLQKNQTIDRRMQYDKRNFRRNQLLQENKVCKGCGTEWKKGSIKLQTFEGFQSLCRRTTQKCNTHIAYKTFC